MNTKRVIAMLLAALWIAIGLHLNGRYTAAMTLTISNIWLAAALLAGGKK